MMGTTSTRIKLRRPNAQVIIRNLNLHWQNMHEKPLPPTRGSAKEDSAGVSELAPPAHKALAGDHTVTQADPATACGVTVAGVVETKDGQLERPPTGLN